MNPELAALSQSPAGPGSRPPSPGSPMMGSSPPQAAPEEEQASSSLGELAVAFLGSANDPPGAAALLLEFLEQAGITRGGAPK